MTTRKKKTKTKNTPAPEAAPPQEGVESMVSKFFMNKEEKLLYASMNDKRKLADEKRVSLNAEMEMAQMIQEQLSAQLEQRLAIGKGVKFAMKADGTVVVMDGGKMGKAAERRAKKQAR